jgi:HAD superfamily hydrolase (TIGR01509 family)
MIKGVLFDMDGVLVDSEEFICKAAILMFKENGLVVQSEDFLPFVGTGENRYLGGVAEKYGYKADIDQIKKRTYEIYGEITKGKLKPMEGVLSFIEKCKTENIKIAVATSADEVKMNINLEEIGLPAFTFDATVNGLEIERKKPFPDIFIKAAGKLNLEPKDCLVVEDAISGVEAAKRAGCKCLAITSSFTADKLSMADYVVDSLGKVPEGALS